MGLEYRVGELIGSFCAFDFKAQNIGLQELLIADQHSAHLIHKEGIPLRCTSFKKGRSDVSIKALVDFMGGIQWECLLVRLKVDCFNLSRVYNMWLSTSFLLYEYRLQMNQQRNMDIRVEAKWDNVFCQKQLERKEHSEELIGLQHILIS